MAYHWHGINARGQRVQGVSQAGDKRQLLAELQAQGVTPLSWRRTTTSIFSSLRATRIKAAHLLDFTQQLAALYGAGVALAPALQIVGEHHDHPGMRALLANIRRMVESGSSFSAALQQYPQYFNHFYCSLIHAGEQAGTLGSMLQQLVIHQEKIAALRQKITKALIYPTVVVMIATLITGALLALVVPRFATLFANFGAELPYYTRLVIALANEIKAYGLYALLILGIMGYGYRLLKRHSPALALQQDQLVLRLPLCKSLVHKANWARFARTLATTHQAGMPITDALPLVANSLGNQVYQRALGQIREQVAAGTNLHLAVQYTGLFPPRLVQILAIGEESGSLATLLEKLAGLLEQEVDMIVENGSKLLEPAIMVILGTLIGGLIAALYLPIFRIGAII